MSSQYYAESLRLCQDNATYYGSNYFFYENQCCYSYTYDTWASTGCFCTDNYCNAKFLQPTIVPRSNETTTYSWYNPENATESPSNSNNDTFSNSQFVSCYDCWYSGNSINTSDDATCSPKTNSREGRVCAGVACQTGSSISSYSGKQFISVNHTMFRSLV